MKSRQLKFVSLFMSACILFCFFGFLSTADSVFGQDTKREPIKVAFATAKGLSYKNDIGEYQSYTYEYLLEIAQYTGWEYEFIEVDGTSNEALTKMLDMLKKGEVDILGEVIKNEATQMEYDFPEYSYGHTYKTLYSLESNQDINESNFMSKNDLRVAVYKNAKITNGQLDDFCKLSNINYSLVNCSSEDEIFDALSSGRADVAVGSDLTPVAGMRTIAKFSSTPFSFAVTKGNSKLINELNSAILTINMVKPFFEKELYEKHFPQASSGVFLSKDEIDFIQTSKPLKVAAVVSLPPLQYIDENKQLSGIFVDITNIVEEKSGLQFEFVIAKDFDEALDMVNKGKVDAICGLPYNYELTVKNDLIMTSSIMSSQMVLVSKKNPGEKLLNKTVGVIGKMTSPRLDDGSRTVVFNTFEECLDSVLNDKIDFAYINLYSAEHYSHYEKYNDLIIIPQANSILDYSLGIKRGANPLLFSVINKAIASISPQETEMIIYQRAANFDTRITFGMFLEENPLVVVWSSIILFVLLIGIGIFIFQSKMKASKILDIENQRYLHLCELASEYIYEYDVKKDILLFSQSFAKMFNFPLRLENYLATFQGKIKPKGGFNEDVLSRLQTLYKGNTDSYITECNCLLSTGEHRWFRNTLAEIKDQDDNIIYLVGKLTDIQSEKDEKNKLEQSALTDGMTGLFNIVAFKNAVDLKLKDIETNAALIIIDIDKFKSINDKLGHYTGDIVLRDFANTIKNSIGKNDIAGRLGGDEFMIFLAESDCEKTSEICNKLCHTARRDYTNEQGVSCGVTISLGAVIINETSNFSTIYKQADQQLYQAKAAGRDQYRITTCE